jgi:hypothetical protein
MLQKMGLITQTTGLKRISSNFLKMFYIISWSHNDLMSLISLECIPCLGGPQCNGGCKIVKRHLSSGPDVRYLQKNQVSLNPDYLFCFVPLGGGALESTEGVFASCSRPLSY